MKKYQNIFIAALLLCLGTISSYAQKQMDNSLVQFSGLVLDGTTDELLPIPYTNIVVKGQSRGTYTDFNGFFSIVVRQGDEIEFSAVGYETVNFIIPDTLSDSRYSVVQLMTSDEYNLPEMVIFPWPSREHFKLEFLAMDVRSDFQERATENLNRRSFDELSKAVAVDGRESGAFYLQQQAAQNYYIGQVPPMNIFNPIAWKQFFDGWKRGDFKKKKD